MGIREVFAANLRYYRKAAHLTQEELAAKAGVHRTYIGGIEQVRINASLGSIEKIANALDIDAALLFMPRPTWKPAPKRTSDSHDDPETAYALVAWTDNGVNVQPLSVRYEDLTIQVLLDLVDRGYSGDGLARAYHRANREIARFIEDRHDIRADYR